MQKTFIFFFFEGISHHYKDRHQNDVHQQYCSITITIILISSRPVLPYTIIMSMINHYHTHHLYFYTTTPLITITANTVHHYHALLPDHHSMYHPHRHHYHTTILNHYDKSLTWSSEKHWHNRSPSSLPPIPPP